MSKDPKSVHGSLFIRLCASRLYRTAEAKLPISAVEAELLRTSRKLITSLLVFAAACATLTVATPASAAAECTNNGPYSFKSSHQTTYATIYAYLGSNCTGSYISYGRTTLSGSNLVIYAYDAKCDNIGLATHTSGAHSVVSTGCGTTNSKTVSRSSSGNSFWVQVDSRLSHTALIPI